MDEQLMIRYLQEECSPEDEALFLEWLRKSDENKKLFYEQKALWNYRNVKQFGTEDQLSKAMANFNRSRHAAELLRKKKVFVRFAKYAAIFIIAFSLSIGLYTTNHRTIADSRLITMSVAQTDSSKIITLSDGTKVWLNSNSSITYPEKFPEGERIIQFIGEAYFEVKHDSLHPFKVQTNNVMVKVLGTSFNVRSYPSERKTETTLVTGKVIIQNKKGDNLAILRPGQMAEFDKKIQHLSVKEVNSDLYTSWRYGAIVFTNTTLNDITQKLSELYQVHFVIQPSMDSAAYNFNFRKNQPIDKVLEMLSFIAPFNYKIQGEEIFLTSK